ncbi:MAG: ABC transporter substrate-binding protein [Alcaligenaceae bacterium]|nr:MAG: ABC transporter substrate-binding protein [Alcaligenaceae bacterium]
MKFTPSSTAWVPALCSAAMAFGSGVVLAQASTGFSNDTVKIGVLTDMSGAFADLSGAGSVESVRMAIEDFKAKHKPGFRIEMVSADHQNKADIGSTKAREWYDTQGVDMITDVINSGVAIAVGKVAQQKNRIVMVTGAGTTRLENEDCNANTIHYGWDTRTNANGQAKAQAERGNKSWYFVAVDYALGSSLVQDATEAVAATGGVVVGAVKHPLGAADFSSYMLQAKASKAQVIGLANAGSDLINAVKASNEFGIAKEQAIAGLVASIIDVHSIGLKTAQGMLVVEDFYWNLNDQTRQWSRRFFDKQKRMPNFVHAATYSSVLTYLRAVQAAGTDTAPEVLGQMKRSTINDVFATNGKIREDNKMVHDVYVLEVKKPSESKEPWDYYHVRRTIAAHEASQPLSASKCAMVKKPA